MAVVVADATPLHYLVLIGEIELLRALYGAIIIPGAVIEELSAPQTPAEVRSWIAVLPSWVSVAHIPAMTPSFLSLGPGEREAIALVRESSDGILLTDDLQARVAAESVGVRVVPTIRILSTASELGMVDIDDALIRLQRTNFRISHKVLASILRSKSVESSE